MYIISEGCGVHLFLGSGIYGKFFCDKGKMLTTLGFASIMFSGELAGNVS